MVTLTEMPPAIAALPRDERGYPVPWFVAWVDGKPEFRCADTPKYALAARRKLCWVCGTPLDPKQHVFVIGPMCALTRTTSEPPCHAECATFSALNCPFLCKPKAVRRDANMPDDASESPGPGFALMRNPGVTCLWYCRGFQTFRATHGQAGTLFHLPGAAMVRWYCQGRKATRGEIMESIETGLPALQELADLQGGDAPDALRRTVANGLKLVPAT